MNEPEPSSATRSDGRRRPGRPRRPGVTEEIKTVARELLLESGWSGFTIAEVARRTGVGKPTIYRRWPTRTALIHDALFAAAEGAIAPPDTGSLHGDLVTLITTFARQFEFPGSAEAARAVMAAGLTAERNDERAEWQRRHEKDRLAVAAMIDRDRSRGERTPDVPSTLLADLVIDWVVHECVVKQEPPSDETIVAVVETVLGQR